MRFQNFLHRIGVDEIQAMPGGIFEWWVMKTSQEPLKVCLFRLCISYVLFWLLYRIDYLPVRLLAVGKHERYTADSNTFSIECE